MDAAEEIGDAFEDVGDWFENDFVDFWEDDFVNFWGPLPLALLGNGTPELSEEDKKKKEQYEELKAKIAEQCAKVHGVNEPGRSGFTTTNDFNFSYSRTQKTRDERAKIYALMGKSDAKAITAESCEAVDCMHQCYG